MGRSVSVRHKTKLHHVKMKLPESIDTPVSVDSSYALAPIAWLLAMYVQGLDNVYDLNCNGREGAEKVTYGDVFRQAEEEYSRYTFEAANTGVLLQHFKDAEACRALLKRGRRRAAIDGPARLRSVHQGLAFFQPRRSPSGKVIF
jgi:glycyl-tRNA synthetase alpha subunit